MLVGTVPELSSNEILCTHKFYTNSYIFVNTKKVLLPLLRPKRDFRRIAYFDECGIDFYWCSEERAIFVVPKSTNDFATLIDLAERMNSAPDEFSCHDIMKDSETKDRFCTSQNFRHGKEVKTQAKNALINLFLLSICHLCLLIQPTTTLDLELDRWFRSIDECRKSLLPSFDKLLGNGQKSFGKIL